MGWIVAVTPGGTVVMMTDKAFTEQAVPSRIISGHKTDEEAWEQLQKERFERYAWKAEPVRREG